MFNSTHIQRIRRSIAALVALLFMGFAVLGSSFILFESNVKAETIPQSMRELNQVPHGGNMLPVFLVVIAAFGLPLGAYVVSTLAACEKKAHETN